MPIQLRRHGSLLLLLVLVVSICVFLLGKQRIIAYTTPGQRQPEAASNDVANTTGLFDDTVVHSIQILVTDADYEQMLTTYRETGEKDYVHADVIIDGVRINDVGLRLKGNASLQTAVGGGRMGRGQNNGAPPGDGNFPQPPGQGQGFPGGGQRPNRGDMPVPPTDGTQQFPPTDGKFTPMPGMNGGPGGLMGPGATGIISGETKTPLLIRFDEFVDGQTYQGYAALAIRTYGVSYDAALLQEPVTNAALRAIGLPATQTAFASVQRNDGEAALYTISEIIDETYLARYFPETNGVLYKSEVGSTLQYQGEDPTQYAASFSQETRVNDADMAPLIRFTNFLSTADDETFARELPNYLDVDSFAAYLAVNNLLVNLDSIVTMGNNYYLYYDDTTGRFTLLMWDANESLGDFSSTEVAAQYNLYYQGQQMGPRMGGDNTLVTRFFATPTFVALYEEKLQQIYQQVFVSGFLTQKIDRYAALVSAANETQQLEDPAAYEAAVARVRDFVTQRTAYLATTSLLGGTR